MKLNNYLIEHLVKELSYWTYPDDYLNNSPEEVAEEMADKLYHAIYDHFLDHAVEKKKELMKFTSEGINERRWQETRDALKDPLA